MNIQWIGPDKNVDYTYALKRQEQYVEDIYKKKSPETIWLLEHPPLYTAGTSAQETDLVKRGDIPVYTAGRGGQYTYHGPGQRVAYVMLNLKQRGQDVRAFVWRLEEWMIKSLADMGIKGERRRDRVGIWVVNKDGSEDKIAAIGVRVRRWVTFHGVSINVNPDLSHYRGIIPCGIKEHGVTSFEKLGFKMTMESLDERLKYHFNPVFSKSAEIR